MARYRRSIRDRLGFRVAHTSPGWTELTQGDAVVGLHGGRRHGPAEVGSSIQVTDLDRAREAVRRGGGLVLEEPASRPGEPIRPATIQDAEGNQFAPTEWLGD